MKVMHNIDDVTLLKLQISEQQQRIDYFENQIRLFRHQRFGPSSETFSPDQLSLLENNADDSKTLDVLNSDSENKTLVKSHQRRKHSKIIINDDIAVERVTIDLKEYEKTCSCCKSTMTHIGDDTTRQVEYIPASLVAKDFVRLKYACKACEGSIKRATLPKRIIPKSIASPSLMAYLIVCKFVDHFPLHRIERMFQRLGLGLPCNVPCDWLPKVAEKLYPLYQLLKQQALSGLRVWTDDTVIPMQNDQKHRKRTIQARLWVYIGGSLNDPPTVFYDFTRARSQTGPLAILQCY